MCLLARLYTWGSTKSLRSRCIRIRTLIEGLYIQSQTICYSAALSKLRGSAIFHDLRVIKARGMTC
jgi:hypothetical protein